MAKLPNQSTLFPTASGRDGDSGFGGASFRSAGNYSRSNSTGSDCGVVDSSSRGETCVDGIRQLSIAEGTEEEEAAGSFLNYEERQLDVSSREERKAQLVTRAFTPDDDGDIYLHRYISQGHVDLALSVIEMARSPQDLDLQNRYQQTPMHLAAVMNQEDVVKLLIMRGARVDITDCRGDNIFHIISQLGNIQALQAVIGLNQFSTIQHQANLTRAVNARNYQGLTPIFNAMKHRQEAIFRSLFSFKVDVNLPDMKNGESPLHEAVRMNSLSFVDLLIRQCGADVDVTDFRNVTPLHLAAGLGHDAIVACLLSNGADANVRDYENRRPCDVAVTKEIFNMLK